MLHWTSAAMLLYLIVAASDFQEMVSSPKKSELIIIHASVGLIFLLLMITRFTWRTLNINPIKSYSIKNWQKLIAVSLHRTIYVVIISQCFFGIVMLITGGDRLSFFGLFRLEPIIDKNEMLHKIALDIHVFISILIYPLLAIHITAAIYHQIFGVIED